METSDSSTTNTPSKTTAATIAVSTAMMLAVGSLLLTPAPVDAAEVASPAAKKGYDIAARADRSERGFKDSEVELKMVLRNAAGDQSARELVITTFEMPDESVGNKSLIVFNTPFDVEGTALLSHAKILSPDDQWLFLPALKRVKRISSRNKSGPFVGSEFAFEDFTSVELNKYDYEFLREEPCGNFTCDVVVRFPRYDNSGYTKQISWIDQSVHQVRKIDFYNRRDSLLKTLSFEKYQDYNGVWRPQLLKMSNHQTKKTTDLIVALINFPLASPTTTSLKNA